MPVKTPFPESVSSQCRGCKWLTLYGEGRSHWLCWQGVPANDPRGANCGYFGDIKGTNKDNDCPIHEQRDNTAMIARGTGKTS